MWLRSVQKVYSYQSNSHFSANYSDLFTMLSDPRQFLLEKLGGVASSSNESSPQNTVKIITQRCDNAKLLIDNAEKWESMDRG